MTCDVLLSFEASGSNLAHKKCMGWYFQFRHETMYHVIWLKPHGGLMGDCHFVPGVTLDGGKRYSQTVDKPFHLSMAALESNPHGMPFLSPLEQVCMQWNSHSKNTILKWNASIFQRRTKSAGGFEIPCCALLCLCSYLKAEFRWWCGRAVMTLSFRWRGLGLKLH